MTNANQSVFARRVSLFPAFCEILDEDVWAGKEQLYSGMKFKYKHANNAVYEPVNPKFNWDRDCVNWNWNQLGWTGLGINAIV